MTSSPRHIRALRQEGVLEIDWDDGKAPLRYPFKFLRCHCPCASCVNEFTGERLLNPETISAEIRPVGIEFSGNYALKIQWDDGHSTGLYSWEHLARLGTDPEVALASRQLP